MAHLHSVYDGDSHFAINPITRTIMNMSSQKTTLIQYDHNSERFTFEIPRYIEGHDMSTCNLVEVHYLNIEAETRQTNEGVYVVDDLQVSPDGDDVVICSWLISQNATRYIGSINFVVRFACVTDDKIDYAWNTAIFSGISVSTGLWNSDVIVQEYPDVLQGWYNELISAGVEGVIDAKVEAIDRIEQATSEAVELLVNTGGTIVSDTEPTEDHVDLWMKPNAEGADIVLLEGSDIVQTTGDAEDKIMSQKAVTDYVKERVPKVATRNLMTLTFENANIANGVLTKITTGKQYAATRDYLAVTGGSTYTLSWASVIAKSTIYISQYNAEKNFISELSKYVSSATSGSWKVTFDEGCAYIRIEIYTNDAEIAWVDLVPTKFQMELGEVVTEYIVPEIIDPKIIDTSELDGAIKNAVETAQATVETIKSELFEPSKNLFFGATLKEGYINSIMTGYTPSANYNCFRGLILQPGITYAVYPQCRYVTNVTKKIDISKTAVTGVYTFSVEEESEIDITFGTSYTDRMVLYNADLYSYSDVEKYYQHVLDTDNIVIPQGEVYGNVLYKKKWVACGDSFTAYTNASFTDGIYKGKNKTYPYLIGLRNNMTIVNEAVSGSTMAVSTGEGGYFANTRYKNIPADADYITLWFGINDNHQSLTIGTIDDTTVNTFYGAWNVVMEYLITNHPFAKIGIVITNGSAPEYTEAERNIAKKWGVPFLDLEKDYHVPLMHRVNERTEVPSSVKNIRMNAFRISGTDHHPNEKAHEYQSTFIEAWLRTL